MLAMFIFEKSASKYLKMPFYVLEPFPINHVTPMVLPAQVQNEVAASLSLGKTAVFSAGCICLMRNSCVIMKII